MLTVRYELKFYINLLRNSVFKELNEIPDIFQDTVTNGNCDTLFSQKTSWSLQKPQVATL
jgi:hypothetical protein